MDVSMYFPILTEQDKMLPFYVSTVGIVNNETKIYRPNGIDDYQILYCVSGEGNVLIQGKMQKVSSGYGFFLSPQTPHNYYATIEPWETHWITFKGNAIEQIFNFGNEVFKIISMDMLEGLFNDIHNLPKNQSWTDESTVMLYRLLVSLKKCISTDNYSPIYSLQDRLKPVTDYLSTNFNIPVELEALADLINITPPHLCRLFSKAYGIRPFEYITRLRLQKSKQLLITRLNLNIAQIGELVGYNSSSYFSHLFKKQEKMSPGTFREMYSSTNF